MAGLLLVIIVACRRRVFPRGAWEQGCRTSRPPRSHALHQNAVFDARRRLEEFIQDPSVPFYIWLRFLVGQRVQEQHRRHLDTPGRDVGREVSMYRGAMPGASTGALAARLLGKLTGPAQAALRAERKIQLQEALNRMDPLDREILVLRHDEQMSNGDAAAALGLAFKATSKRYTRALERLAKILKALPGDMSGFGA
jgi:RNA polymerase sigma-70 factor, ECF subfamily